MFYPVQLSEPKPGEKRICALVVLNPSESRRLLAMATVALPVQNAMKNGMIIIGRGITNAYVTERAAQDEGGAQGRPDHGHHRQQLCQQPSGPPPCTWHVIYKGKVMEGRTPTWKS
jgi:hypothetical protein